MRTRKVARTLVERARLMECCDRHKEEATSCGSDIGGKWDCSTDTVKINTILIFAEGYDMYNRASYSCHLVCIEHVAKYRTSQYLILLRAIITSIKQRYVLFHT